MFFEHLRDLSFIWPFREANTRTYELLKFSEHLLGKEKLEKMTHLCN